MDFAPTLMAALSTVPHPDIPGKDDHSGASLLFTYYVPEEYLCVCHLMDYFRIGTILGSITGWFASSQLDEVVHIIVWPRAKHSSSWTDISIDSGQRSCDAGVN